MLTTGSRRPPSFDPDDIDAAFEELDSRYIAGEAAAQAHTWSAITRVYAALNRRELPDTAPDFVDIDHRHLAAIRPGDLMAYLRTALEEDSARSSITMRPFIGWTSLGAVVTHVAKGTSRGGFSAEWRITGIYTVEGDLMTGTRSSKRPTSMPRSRDLTNWRTQTPRLENAASQVYERFQARFAALDWAAIPEMLVADLYSDDRRSLVGGGIRNGRDALVEDLRAVADAL